jgi:hypothetical protein
MVDLEKVMVEKVNKKERKKKREDGRKEEEEFRSVKKFNPIKTQELNQVRTDRRCFSLFVGVWH